MIIEINRDNSHRRFAATAVDPPINPAQLLVVHPSRQPVVAVFGHRGRVTGLQPHLPTGWTLRRPTSFDQVRADELVLFANATVGEVAQARAVLSSRTRIVALVDEDAAAEVVAAVLTAGADACVRGGQPAILASHLVACRRRQLAERWVTLDAQARR